MKHRPLTIASAASLAFGASCAQVGARGAVAIGSPSMMNSFVPKEFGESIIAVPHYALDDMCMMGTGKTRAIEIITRELYQPAPCVTDTEKLQKEAKYLVKRAEVFAQSFNIEDLK